jgi:hypothetical protein
MALPWSERVPMLSIHPHAASVADIAQLAVDLMNAMHTIDTLTAERDALQKKCDDYGSILSQWGNIDKATAIAERDELAARVRELEHDLAAHENGLANAH